MAQECGFFNAQQINEEEYDRVYLAEQFAAYFASFIGNGVFGKSMQKLEVLAQTSPDMSVKVLSGEAWINGWWYRNTEEYTLPLDVADGVLNRIDAIVLRWGNRERDMWLQVIKGVASSNPVAPNILRDADYYDLQLATVSVARGSIKLTQSAISDTRLNNAVCGLVTGVVDQIDTTGLYNQFERYFEEFKERYEKDYADWTDAQKAAYKAFIANQQKLYEDWVKQKQDGYDTWVADKIAEYIAWTNKSKKDYDDWIDAQQTDFVNWLTEHQEDQENWTDEQREKYLQWIKEQKEDFAEWYDSHTTSWTTDFYNWFNNIKAQLSGDVAGKLQDGIDKVEEKVDGYVDQVTTFSSDGKTITQVSGNQKIITIFEDQYHIRQDFYVDDVKIKSKAISFSTDGKEIIESKEVI